MLTPEALAALNWSADGATDPSFKLYPATGRRYHQIDGPQGTICDTLSRDPSITDEEDAAYSALLAASPALALACLEALRVFRLQAADGDRGERASLEPVIDVLEAALEAAGVEVDDD